MIKQFHFTKKMEWMTGMCLFTIMENQLFITKQFEDFLELSVRAYKICEEQPLETDFMNAIKEQMTNIVKLYYDGYYQGDKSVGFETWFKKLMI